LAAGALGASSDQPPEAVAKPRERLGRAGHHERPIGTDRDQLESLKPELIDALAGRLAQCLTIPLPVSSIDLRPECSSGLNATATPTRAHASTAAPDASGVARWH
jgi:hypothetical protein